MNRKTVWMLILFALASAHPAEGQPKQLPRIGYLAVGRTTDSPRTDAFRQGLRDLGDVEGQNIIVEYRYGDRQKRKDGLVELAIDLVSLQVDVIVALDSSSARAVRKTTSTIPIVMRIFGDPVEEGLITTLARTGGNITGLYSITEELTEKRLRLLKEVSPRLARVGILWNPNFRASSHYFKEARFAATSLDLQLQSRFKDKFLTDIFVHDYCGCLACPPLKTLLDQRIE